MSSFFALATCLGLAGIVAAQGTCPVFPADNIWNTPISQLPVHPSSSTWVTTIGATTGVHADFGSGLYAGGPIGIPFVNVPATQTKYPATFLYQSESDPGPYAVPLDAPIEGGNRSNGDRHAISIDTGNCVLYELYRAFPLTASWRGDSGAIYNLFSHALRPASWTSADAAGLPIFAGLVRFDDILAGEIRHALRFTVSQTQKAYVWPARHYASSLTGPQYPPMGARFRLRADFDVSSYSATNRIILNALKKYGMMLADNGSNWYLSGAPDSRWDNDDLHALGNVKGSDFEAVDVSPLIINIDSGQALQTSVSVSVTPAAASVPVGATLDFAATVLGNADQRVTWDVNGAVGGNGTVGFVDSITGLYTAPAAPPVPPVVTVRAVSVAVPSASGSAAVTVTDSNVTISPLSASVRINRTVQFTANTAVTWAVNGVTGGSPQTGTINPAGLFTAPAAVPSPATVTVTAAGIADPGKTANAAVAVTRR